MSLNLRVDHQWQWKQGYWWIYLLAEIIVDIEIGYSN